MLKKKEVKTAAILHGHKFESVAVEAFESLMKKKTESCGIFICNEYPQLAASPDRIVDEDTILEVKCPYSSKDKCISPVTVPYLYSTNGKIDLCKNHDYFYQIQGQLLCTKRNKCYFVIYTFKEIVIVEIERDDQFISNMVKKLLSFYESHFKRALIDKFMYKNYYDFSF